jgi:hypothetical protein
MQPDLGQAVRLPKTHHLDFVDPDFQIASELPES